MEAVTNLNSEVITLTGKDVDSRLFNATFNRLCQFQFTNPKIAYNIGYIAEKVKSLTKPKYKTDLGSVHEIEVEIRKKKLDVNVLSEAGFALSANDISVLEPLLCGLED